MRSHAGCVICRHRKLKCDEVRPVCGQCLKASRRCEFSSDTIFRHFETPDDSPTRQQDSESPNAVRKRVWLEVPRRLTFVQVEDPYEGETEESIEAAPAPTQGLQPNVPDRPARQTLEVAVRTTSPQSGDPSHPILEDDKVLRLQLLMHFKHSLSQWMDIFDINAYFSGKVTTLAPHRPLLLTAICALAAKHIHRIRRTPSYHHVLKMSFDISPVKEPDWRYRSCYYYDEAIGQLKQALKSYPLGVEHTDSHQFPEEVLASIAILSMYELMDAPGTEWITHLGALPLLCEASQNVADAASPSLLPSVYGRRSLFWNFARQDVLSAFVHEKQTQLDLDNVDLWTKFGLSAGISGFPPPPEPSFATDLATVDKIGLEEDTFSNAMTWILGKIMNYITAGDSLSPADFQRPTGQRLPTGVAQEVLLERWTQLETLLDRWRVCLPPVFKPCARTPHIASQSQSTDRHPAEHFEKIWYSNPICAAAMQTYHMARIILLVNRPQESTAIRSTVTARLRSYRDTMQQTTHHGREICGISLSKLPDAVRIHSLQPLFVAGQCFSDKTERDVVVELLTDVERDLGWASAYCVDKLRKEWS